MPNLKTWGNTDNTGSITITNNTFCKTMANKDFANQLPNTNTLTTTIQYNIFMIAGVYIKLYSHKLKDIQMVILFGNNKGF